MYQDCDPGSDAELVVYPLDRHLIFFDSLEAIYMILPHHGLDYQLTRAD